MSLSTSPVADPPQVEYVMVYIPPRLNAQGRYEATEDTPSVRYLPASQAVAVKEQHADAVIFRISQAK